MTDAVDKLADDVQELKLGALCFLIWLMRIQICRRSLPVSYTHLRAHET